MEQQIHTFFDSPKNYPGKENKYFQQGNSPLILQKFIEFLQENEGKIKSIYGSMYLFNNPILHDEFKRLAQNGVKITIVSIPLEGYDDRSPQWITDSLTGKLAFPDQHTKMSMARKVYAELTRNGCGGNYSLHIFPHMFVRSENVTPFSRGNMPYSLHVKSFLIEYKDGGGAVALSTSNLAFRDRMKNEAMAIIENNEGYNSVSKKYFADLLENSIDAQSFDESANYSTYIVTNKPQPTSPGNFFIAPFYEDSPDKSGVILQEAISNATKRVYICAQHISAYQYTYPANFKQPGAKGDVKVPGFLAAALEKAKNGIDVRFLSQTFVDSKGDSRGCRSPANKTSFSNFIKELEKVPSFKCAANSSVHSKFIVIDDYVILTTCNFTPTQFIYLKHVDLPKFFRMPGLSYKGIHSEVGQYVVLNDPITVGKFVQHFQEVYADEKTYRHGV
jgi:phosphatidylserine/phosphatidylglycerophosphate/cardiolipin synthase-like enzyme